MSGLAGVAGEAVSSWLVRGLILVSVMTVAGCQTRPEILGAPVTGFNHTSANINYFTINDVAGPNIAPYQGGGKQVCCSDLPRKWNSELKAVVNWETDPEPYAYGKWQERISSDAWKQRFKEHEKRYKRHQAVVQIPQYAEEVCALQVHFLPCDQVRVSTTCFTPSNPKYPDNAYFEIKESTTCPVL